MSDEEKDSKVSLPLEVKIVNHPEKQKSDYEEAEDNEYENMYPTDEQIKEYNDEETV